jgi:hypothetical protein
MNRLETMSSDLAAQLRLATAAKQCAASLAACEFALAKAKIDNPVVDAALRRLLTGTALTREDKARIESLAGQFDEEYLDLQEAAGEGRAAPADYLRRFAEARAVAALAFVCKGNDPEAVADAIYEAATSAGDDKQQLLAIVQSVLRKV